MLEAVRLAPAWQARPGVLTRAARLTWQEAAGLVKPGVSRMLICRAWAPAAPLLPTPRRDPCPPPQAPVLTAHSPRGAELPRPRLQP